MKKKPKVDFLRFDEPEMIYQRIEIKGPNDEIIGDFYVCRFYGSRDCWIDAKVLDPQWRKFASAIPFLCRQGEVDGRTIHMVPIDWLLEHCKVDTASRQWLEAMSTALDHNITNGQLDGKLLYLNP